jgi:hypothetical protein
MTPSHAAQWQRYAYRSARALLDRLDGHVTQLVERQATPTIAQANAWARAGLDAGAGVSCR